MWLCLALILAIDGAICVLRFHINYMLRPLDLLGVSLRTRRTPPTCSSWRPNRWMSQSAPGHPSKNTLMRSRWVACPAPLHTRTLIPLIHLLSLRLQYEPMICAGLLIAVPYRRAGSQSTSRGPLECKTWGVHHPLWGVAGISIRFVPYPSHGCSLQPCALLQDSALHVPLFRGSPTYASPYLLCESHLIPSTTLPCCQLVLGLHSRQVVHGYERLVPQTQQSPAHPRVHRNLHESNSCF